MVKLTVADQLAHMAELAEIAEDLAAAMAVNVAEPLRDPRHLAVIGAGYLLRLAGNDLEAVIAYEDEPGQEPVLAELLTQLRAALQATDPDGYLPPR